MMQFSQGVFAQLFYTTTEETFQTVLAGLVQTSENM